MKTAAEIRNRSGNLLVLVTEEMGIQYMVKEPGIEHIEYEAVTGSLTIVHFGDTLQVTGKVRGDLEARGNVNPYTVYTGGSISLRGA